MRKTTRMVLTAVVFSMFAGLALPAQADIINYYWDLDADGAWGTNTNWGVGSVPLTDPSAAPGLDSSKISTDMVHFRAGGSEVANPKITTPRTVTLGADAWVYGIEGVLRSGPAWTVTWTLATGSNTLHVGSGGISIPQQSGESTFKITGKMSLDAPQTLQNAVQGASRYLDLNCTISGASSAAVNLLGPGVIKLYGNNTFAGDATIGSFGGASDNNGHLYLLGTSTGFGSSITSGPLGTGTVHISTGARILGTSSNPVIGNNVTIDGDFWANCSTGSTSYSGAQFTIGGTGSTVTLTTSPTITSIRTLTIAAPIGESGGSRGLTWTGTGILVLSAANTYTGPTTVNASTLKLSDANGALYKGTAVGNTIIHNAGALLLDGTTANADRLPDSAPVTMYTGTLTLSGNTRTETVGEVTANGGYATLSTNNTSAALTLTSLTRQNKGTVLFDRRAGSITVNGGGLPSVNGIAGGWAVVQTGTSTFDWVAGGGTSVAAYSGYNLNLAYSSWDSTKNVKWTTAGTTVFTGGDATINSLYMNATSITTLQLPTSATLTIGSGGILATGNTTNQISSTSSSPNNSKITAGSDSDYTLYINTPVSTDGFFVSASTAVVNNGANPVTVVKSGAGNLTFSGANSTYTGGLVLQAGNLYFGGTSNHSVPLLTVMGGAVDIGSGSAKTVTVAGLTGNGGRFGSGSSATLAITFDDTADGQPYTYSGNINPGTTNWISITKSGTGTQVLAGANTYTGATTINGGTLQFAKQNSLATWTTAGFIVNSGATLALNVGGTGEFTAANVDTFKALGTASGGFKSGSFLGLDTTNASGGEFVYGSAIANPNSGNNVLGLTKLGTGTLTLANASTYTGGTNINAGTLTVSHANALGTTGTITVNDGGKLAVAADITFSRTFTLNSGGKIGGNGTFAPSGGVTVGSGAYLDPGFSPGVTSFSTGLTVNGTYLWDLAVLSETGAGTNYDLALVTGGNIAGSNATLSIVFGSDSLKPANDPMDAFWISPHTWTIIENSGSGTTANPFTTVADQADWSGKGTFTTGLSLDGTDVVLNWQPVPEPATMAFLALGGLSMFVAALRRRRTA